MKEKIDNLNKHKYFLRIVKFLDNGLLYSESLIKCNSIKDIKREKDKNKKSDDGLIKLRRCNLNYKYLVYNLNKEITKKLN